MMMMMMMIMLFTGLSVKCYVGVEPAGERFKLCDLSRGLRTCYIKYDMCKLRLAIHTCTHFLGTPPNISIISR